MFRGGSENFGKRGEGLGSGNISTKAWSFCPVQDILKPPPPKKCVCVGGAFLKKKKIKIGPQLMLQRRECGYQTNAAF